MQKVHLAESDDEDKILNLASDIRAFITKELMQYAVSEEYLADVEKHSRMLYAEGIDLQDICRLTLEKLGAVTKASTELDEFIVESNSEEVFIDP